MKEENLIFIISQPRSGSTYLQSLLSNNPYTNTSSEPWLLLNYANQIKPELIEGVFDNKLAIDAYNEYKKKYSKFDFDKKQHDFLLSLYEPMFDGYHYVIDKTPRYWEILDEIVELFPKSKIVIVKRNPIDVAKSIIKTWNIKSFSVLDRFRRDLLIGPFSLFEFIEKQKLNPNVYVLKYEALILDLELETEKLYNWIGIPFEKSILDTKNNKKYKGKFGDPFQNTPGKNYSEVKIKAHTKDLLPFLEEFLNGYSYFLGNKFLTEYGNYSFVEKDIKSNRLFKYFLNRGDAGKFAYSYKSELIKLFKTFYYERILRIK